MRARFTVTYNTMTPESAERGDYAESGFVFPDGDRIECEAAQTELGADWRAHWPPPWVHMTLAQAVAVVGLCEDNGDSFYECDESPNYATGASETRAVHIQGKVTPASNARLRRIFCGR